MQEPNSHGDLMSIILNDKPEAVRPEERLIDLINRSGIKVPQVCYHHQLGPIQSCDTCMVEVDGKLVRACGTLAADGSRVNTEAPRAQAAQREAFDRILGNHMLYCRGAKHAIKRRANGCPAAERHDKARGHGGRAL
jgi:predicted molibdopterin-dependent oxidoreductase YjgC